MLLLQSLATQLAITIANRDVWLSIAQALLLGGVALTFGIWVARRVGLLRSTAPVGETLAIGLASGLLVLAAWWAAVISGGRTAFTPVAIGFGVAIVLSVVRRSPKTSAAGVPHLDGAGSAAPIARGRKRATLILTAVLAAAFITLAALLYGSTLALSPQEGAQPVEFMDEAYYAVLGRDLAETGTETTIQPSGFSSVDGVPAQVWYHWGALWLASALIRLLGAEPLAARHLVVLPVVLLSAASLTGTLVRLFAGTTSRFAYMFGVLASLFLAPISFAPTLGPSNVGLIFGITTYGLATPAALLSLYCLAVIGKRRNTWAFACFASSAMAFLLSAHIAVAALALLGFGAVALIRTGRSVVATRRLPTLSALMMNTMAAAGLALVATAAWGQLTGHTLGAGGFPTNISPFNAAWLQSVGLTVLGTGVFLAVPIAWWITRGSNLTQADLYLGAMALVAGGAIAWGARLPEFTTFYLFYAGIALFGTVAAAVAVWTILTRLRDARRLRLALACTALCVAQLELGVVTGLLRLQEFGPGAYEPIPLPILTAIRRLPPDAKLAYSCEPFEEVSFADPRLLSIDAHTARRVVPMCYEAETLTTMIGAPQSLNVPNTFFKWAPQRALYPDAAAAPSSEAVASFLRHNGIDYIYADARHPNSLVTDAVPIARSGDDEILLVP